LDSIAHRGPDAEGEWVADNVYLGHRRLSIIDLATGNQPMESWDGRYVIVFNGEIYNFPELREILSANGARFRTSSDTEVIIEAFRSVDLEAVRDLMVYDYILAPRTIFKNVQKLEPGCRFEWRLGQTEPTIQRYWSPPLSRDNLAPPESDELEDLLEQAVKR